MLECDQCGNYRKGVRHYHLKCKDGTEDGLFLCPACKKSYEDEGAEVKEYDKC